MFCVFHFLSVPPPFFLFPFFLSLSLSLSPPPPPLDFNFLEEHLPSVSSFVFIHSIVLFIISSQYALQVFMFEWLGR